jgi:hypothetical protein
MVDTQTTLRFTLLPAAPGRDEPEGANAVDEPEADEAEADEPDGNWRHGAHVCGPGIPSARAWNGAKLGVGLELHTTPPSSPNSRDMFMCSTQNGETQF